MRHQVLHQGEAYEDRAPVDPSAGEAYEDRATRRRWTYGGLRTRHQWTLQQARRRRPGTSGPSSWHGA
jgi:hypothetical protein